MTEHNITLTDEMVRKWIEDWAGGQMKGPVTEYQRVVYASAAQWGWDQRAAVNEAELQKARGEELDACCEWLSVCCPSYARELRNARRPKPPSLKEQGLEALGPSPGKDHAVMIDHARHQAILAALEALPDDN